MFHPKPTEERHHFYWKCGHVVYEEEIPAGEAAFSYDYCPNCSKWNAIEGWLDGTQGNQRQAH